MVGFEVEVNGMVIGRALAGPALDAVLEALQVGDVVALRAIEAGAVGDGRIRPLALKRRSRSREQGGEGGGRRWVALTLDEILRWADAHFERSGAWPTKQDDEAIPESAGLKWMQIDVALRKGLRGLVGGSSLARLLAAERGVRNRKALPPLTEAQILEWADAHFARTGSWPTGNDGAIEGAPGETWVAVEMGLANGVRGLPGGTSLARLLAAQRGKRNPAMLPALTEEMVLAWADAHHAETGSWPNSQSGAVLAAPGEEWSAVDRALRSGHRGLPGGSSVVKLLAARRGARNRKALPRLTEAQILSWAEAHYERTGRWPNGSSGVVVDSPEDRWSALAAALRDGNRGLAGGSSLAKLLAAQHGVSGRVGRSGSETGLKGNSGGTDEKRDDVS